MARIFKGSRYTLNLMITYCGFSRIENVSIMFFTTDSNVNVTTNENIVVTGNIANVTVDSDLFDGLSEGVINYVINCTMDGKPFITERQSNYYLKNYSQDGPKPLNQIKEITIIENGCYVITPDEGYAGLSEVAIDVNVPAEEGGDCNLEDKWVTPSMGDRDDNGLIVVTPSDGYDGLSRTVISPGLIYDEGFEAGKAEGGGGEGGSCNLEDKWVYPTMGDIDGNGYVVVSPSEGYDAMSRVVVSTEDISYATNGELVALKTIYQSQSIMLGERDAFESDLYNYLNNPSNTSLTGFFNNLTYFGSDKYEGLYEQNIPYYTLGYRGDSNSIVDIRELYNGENKCQIMHWGGMQCQNVEYCQDAFKGWNDLVIIEKLDGLGENFSTPQTLSFEDSPLLFYGGVSEYFTHNFAYSLFDFTANGGNSKGVTTSYIKFHPNAFNYNKHKDATIQILTNKGWVVTFDE